MAMCKFMGWSFEALMHTPQSRVDRLLYWMKEQAEEADN